MVKRYLSPDKKVVRFSRRGSNRRIRVHRKQVISPDALPFLADSGDHCGPMLRRNTATLLPFLNRRAVLADIGSHGSERVPGTEQVVKRSHAREYASDELSVQVPPMIPMTNLVSMRTISPMGRATTPVRLRAEMAKRLSSARVVAGFATKKQAADALRIGLDRYEKWESGRTPIPAQYIGPICALYRVDANYLYDIEPRQPARETA